MPIVAFGMVCNDRRLAYVCLAFAGIATLLLSPWTRFKRRFCARSAHLRRAVHSAVHAARLGLDAAAAVLAARGWLRSIVVGDPNQGNQADYRDLENINVLYTLASTALIPKATGTSSSCSSRCPTSRTHADVAVPPAQPVPVAPGDRRAHRLHADDAAARRDAVPGARTYRTRSTCGCGCDADVHRDRDLVLLAVVRRHGHAELDPVVDGGAGGPREQAGDADRSMARASRASTFALKSVPRARLSFREPSTRGYWRQLRTDRADNRACESPPRTTPESRSCSEISSSSASLPAPLDGVFGPKTKAALEHFEKQHGLRVDGQADAATLAALRTAVQQKAAAKKARTDLFTKGARSAGKAVLGVETKIDAAIADGRVSPAEKQALLKAIEAGKLKARGLVAGQSEPMYEALNGAERTVKNDHLLTKAAARKEEARRRSQGGAEERDVRGRAQPVFTPGGLTGTTASRRATSRTTA